MGKVKIKPVRFSRETKAVLEILIHEIQEILKRPTGWPFTLAEIRKLLDSWIQANDLHPEQVATLAKEEFKRRFGIE